MAGLRLICSLLYSDPFVLLLCQDSSLLFGGRVVFPPEAPELFTIAVPVRSSNICF